MENRPAVLSPRVDSCPCTPFPFGQISVCNVRSKCYSVNTAPATVCHFFALHISDKIVMLASTKRLATRVGSSLCPAFPCTRPFAPVGRSLQNNPVQTTLPSTSYSTFRSIFADRADDVLIARSASAAAADPVTSALGDHEVSVAASSIIQYAINFARVSETFETHSWMLLLGLLKHEDCRAALILKDMGLDDLYGAWNEVRMAGGDG